MGDSHQTAPLNPKVGKSVLPDVFLKTIKKGSPFPFSQGVLEIHLHSRAGQWRIDQSSFLDWVSSSIGGSQRREPLFSMALECEWQAKTYLLQYALAQTAFERLIYLLVAYSFVVFCKEVL